MQFRGKWRMTPMSCASFQGELGVCKYLLEQGAGHHIRQAEKGGETPLMKACRGGHLNVATWLYLNGAATDVTRADTVGRTPLQVACDQGHLHITKWLWRVSGGVAGPLAGLRERNKKGDTPLKIASAGLHLATAQWLILHGAASDDDGKIIFGAILCDTAPLSWSLLTWSRAQVECHRAFAWILRGVCVPDRSNTSELRSISGFREVRQVLADFVGVPYGRTLRIMRELAACMSTIMGDDEDTGEE